ncbi:hypothetical protein [Actinophytocola xanthii]|uniref:hypothetical protein n=1 Tax=Actinophytocola xanthii TaxID=1912961 RepID=UPI000946A53B|nr:hypothetical protein [Actinophytocola xanthii]
MTAIYQAARSETLTLLNINIALVGAELAYLTASVAFLGDVGKLPPTAVALVPAPLWLGLLYNVIIIALSGRHGNSLVILERHMHRYAGIPPDEHALIGSRAGEYVVNPGPSGSWWYRPTIWLIYLIAPALILGYTWYVLATLVRIHLESPSVFAGGLIGYGIAAGVLAAAVTKAMRDTPKTDAAPNCSHSVLSICAHRSPHCAVCVS